jgi:ribonucleotide reductase beta subunit family protein with ferritin-like domain
MAETISDIINDPICSFAKGEERGVHLLKQLILFAPNNEAAFELRQQIEDEVGHEEIFNTRLKDLDIDCEGLSKNLDSLYDYAQTCVDEKDWVKSVSVQAVIEELAMASFIYRYPELDEKTQIVLKKVIEDEKRHLEFCITQLAKFADSDSRARTEEVHKNAISIMRAAAEQEGLSKDQLNDAKEIMKKAYFLHYSRLKKIGIALPKVSFSGTKLL